MHNKIEQGAQIATAAGSATSTGSGLWMWLGHNHDQIAAVGVLVGIIVGVVGLLISAYFQYKNHKHILSITSIEEISRLANDQRQDIQ